MPPTYKCKVCGEKVKSLVKHIAEKHRDHLEGRTLRQGAESLFVVKTTVRDAKKYAGIASGIKKICPRCGRQYRGRVSHMIEYHLPLILCARYTLRIEQTEAALMFFDGGVSGNDISAVFQALKHRDDIEADIDELPVNGVPICGDGNGGIRVMDGYSTGNTFSTNGRGANILLWGAV